VPLPIGEGGIPFFVIFDECPLMLPVIGMAVAWQQ
jgi:hypothetical protein